MAKAVKSKKSEETLVEEVVIPTETNPTVTEPEVLEVTPEPVKEEVPVFVAPIVKSVTPSNDLSMEDNIIKFVEENPLNRFKLNEFLKSAYGVQKWNEPPKWEAQIEGKLLGQLLDKLQKQGYFTIESGKHLLLGKPYYTVPDQRQLHYTLNNVEIFVKK